MEQGNFPAGPVAASGSRGRTFVIVAVIIVLALAAAAYWYYDQNKETVREISPGTTITEAATGRIVSEFPRELILETGATVTASYRIEYSDGNVSQPVVSYTSEKDVRANILAFREYLTANDWILREEGNSTDTPATFILAFKDAAEANVTLQVLPEGKTQVTIAYAVKG